MNLYNKNNIDNIEIIIIIIMSTQIFSKIFEWIRAKINNDNKNSSMVSTIACDSNNNLEYMEKNVRLRKEEHIANIARIKIQKQVNDANIIGCTLELAKEKLELSKDKDGLYSIELRVVEQDNKYFGGEENDHPTRCNVAICNGVISRIIDIG